MASSDDQTYIHGLVPRDASIKGGTYPCSLCAINVLDDLVFHYREDVIALVVSLFVDLSSNIYQECTALQIKLDL